MSEKNTPDEAPATVVEEAKDKVDETVETAVPEPVKETADNPTEEMPEWGQKILDKVNELEAIVSKPVEDGLPEMPGHGNEIRDESPSRKPWTHRSLFGGK